MPSARTWLRAIGNVKATAQTSHDITIFTIKATQYVSGSGTTAKLTEFDIIVRHNVAKKNLHERTKKAKLGSKVSIVGELDVYESKLCVELHNFEFISNTNPYITTSITSTHPLCILTIICFRKKNPSVQLTKRIYEYKQPVQEAQDN